jgi:hypothetical protein
MANIQIKDFVGKEIESTKLELKKGMNKFEIQTNNREKGIYYFTLTIPYSFTKTIKHVILK